MLGCSCSYINSFCQTSSYRPDDLVIQAVIIDDIDYGIVIKNIDVIRGSDERDTITVWDGTDGYCNGIISMDASQIGNAGDTILIILSKIDSLENVWDILGDYRMPEWFCYEYKLTYSNGTLNGIINGYYPYYYLGYYNYDEFVNSWVINSETCEGIPTVEIKELTSQNIQIFPNPSKDFFTISGLDEVFNEYTVSDAAGRVIITGVISNSKIVIDMTRFSKGIYFFQTRNKFGKVIETILVKD